MPKAGIEPAFTAHASGVHNRISGLRVPGHGVAWARLLAERGHIALTQAFTRLRSRPLYLMSAKGLQVADCNFKRVMRWSSVCT